MNALIQEQVTRALRNSKKDSKSSKIGQKDHSENSSDSVDGSDSREEWGELLVLNPGEKGNSHRVTTTTLGTVKGNQETTENIYLNLCKSIKNLNLDIPRQ